MAQHNGAGAVITTKNNWDLLPPLLQSKSVRFEARIALSTWPGYIVLGNKRTAVTMPSYNVVNYPPPNEIKHYDKSSLINPINYTTPTYYAKQYHLSFIPHSSFIDWSVVVNEFAKSMAKVIDDLWV